MVLQQCYRVKIKKVGTFLVLNACHPKRLDAFELREEGCADHRNDEKWIAVFCFDEGSDINNCLFSGGTGAGWEEPRLVVEVRCTCNALT